MCEQNGVSLVKGHVLAEFTSDPETGITTEHWRLAITQRANGFGTPEWRARVRRESRRAWLRHPLRMARASRWTRRAKRQRGRG